MNINRNLGDILIGMAVGEAMGIPYDGEEKGEFVCGGMTASKGDLYSAGKSGKITQDAITITNTLADANDFLKSYEYFELFNSLDISCVASLAALGDIRYVTNEMAWIELSEGILNFFGEYTDAFLYLSIIGLIMQDNNYEEIETLILNTANCSYLADLFEIDIIVDTHKDAFRAALWCFIHTDNFNDCVLKAVNLGGRTSETAAIAGAIAGGYYGVEYIPSNWVAVLKSLDDILDI